IDEGSQRIQNGKRSTHICNQVVSGVRSPMAFWKRQIFPTGKLFRASPKCAEIRHQNQSTLRAQGTISRNGHTASDVAPLALPSSWSVCRSKKEQEATLGMPGQSLSTPAGLHQTMTPVAATPLG